MTSGGQCATGGRGQGSQKAGTSSGQQKPSIRERCRAIVNQASKVPKPRETSTPGPGAPARSVLRVVTTRIPAKVQARAQAQLDTMIPLAEWEALRERTPWERKMYALVRDGLASLAGGGEYVRSFTIRTTSKKPPR